MSLTVSFINYYFLARGGSGGGFGGGFGARRCPSGAAATLTFDAAFGALGAFGQFFGFADDDVIVVGAGNGALDQQ